MKSYVYKWIEGYYFNEDDTLEVSYYVKRYDVNSFARLVNIITNDFFPPLSNSASARTNIVFIFLFNKDDEEKWNKTFKILNKRYKFEKGRCCGDYKHSHSSYNYHYLIEVYIYDKIDFDLIPSELENEIIGARKFIILEFKTIRDV